MSVRSTSADENVAIASSSAGIWARSSMASVLSGVLLAMKLSTIATPKSSTLVLGSAASMPSTL